MSSTKPANNRLRFDLRVIADWVAPYSRLLDLGCGGGELLYFLKARKQIIGTGIEHREARAARCIEKGLTVLQGDINREIDDYPDDAFDYVVLSQTLQQVYEPAKLIESMLRIGRRGIVSFPNFSHWSVRLQVLLTGFAPVTRQLPYQWHNTPNIRVITLKDFRRFSRQVGFRIIDEVAINTQNKDRHGIITRAFSDLRATYGIFLIGRNTDG